MIEGRAGRRKAHAAELDHHVLDAFDRLGAQAAADAVGLVDHGLETELHQLERRHDAGDAGADDRDLGAVLAGGNRAEAGRMLCEIVEREREVRPEHGQRRGHGTQLRYFTPGRTHSISNSRLEASSEVLPLGS